MNNFLYLTLIITIWNSYSIPICSNSRFKLRAILRGNYQNVMSMNGGAIISSTKVTLFAGADDNGVFRDAIYFITASLGYTYCAQGQSIVIDLLQAYELNTIVIRFYDSDIRTYDVIVYAIFNGIENIVLDLAAALSITNIRFNDQLVSQFKIYSRGGNSLNQYLHLIKVEAYYKY